MKSRGISKAEEYELDKGHRNEVYKCQSACATSELANVQKCEGMHDAVETCTVKWMPELIHCASILHMLQFWPFWK